MKILLSSEWYRPIINGVVTSMLNLRKELVARGHDVRVLTISRTKNSYEKEGVYNLGSTSFEGIYPNVRLAFFTGRELLRDLIDWCPDVIHTQTEFSSFRYARKIASQTNSALIHTYHTVYEDYTHYFAPNRHLGKFAVKHFTRNVLSKVDDVIVPTSKVERLLQSYGIDRKVHVIPTGLDLSKFKDEISKEERKSMRNRYGLSENEPIAVYVGRIAEEKNLEEILLYFSKLERIKLLLVGDGPHITRLKKMVQELSLCDRVVFTGMVPPSEVASFYQLGEVFVCASNSETQGLTYIEAMASGLPILVKKDDCLEEVVRDGENGWMYRSEADFSKKILNLFENVDLRRQMSEDAKKHSHEYFSSEKFALNVEKVYCNALEHKDK